MKVNSKVRDTILLSSVPLKFRIRFCTPFTFTADEMSLISLGSVLSESVKVIL